MYAFRHETIIHAKCPFNQEWDYYDLIISCDTLLKCEDLQDICNTVRGNSMSQESLSELLFSEFLKIVNGNFELLLVGKHGQNSKLTCHLISEK